MPNCLVTLPTRLVQAGYRLGDSDGQQWMTTRLALTTSRVVFTPLKTAHGPLILARVAERTYVLVGAVAYRISPLSTRAACWDRSVPLRVAA